jgi:hypothetical protein
MSNHFALLASVDGKKEKSFQLSELYQGALSTLKKQYPIIA